jgi:dolichyl-phosphate beta-glucosyltransferase
LRVLQSAKGKGSAVQHGVLAAEGEYRFMCDADLSMPVEEIVKFIPPTLQDVDIAIASREARGAARFNEPSYRHWGGRGINFLIQTLILPGLNDTQCGFKCFRGEVAEDLFRRQTLHGWSFDIELLYIARRHGYRIVEIPIHWYHFSDSKVSAVRDAMRMISDIFRIHANARRGLYDAS